MSAHQTMIKSPKLFHFFVMLYATFMLADQVMMYRVVQAGPFYLTAGVFIMPLYYFTGDLIAEIYGYHVSRRVIWSMVICSILFAVLITILNMLPVPADWHHRAAYVTVLGRLLRSTIGGVAIAVVSGSYFNAYVISKLKILVRGKLFMARSIGSSAIGEAIQMILGCLLLFTGVMPFNKVVILMLELYVFQVGIGFLISGPGALFVNFLKKFEGDVYDHTVSFNPFK